MTDQDDAVRRAAAEILPLLPDLVDRTSAETMARDLRSALELDGEGTSIRIGEILRQDPATREWMRRRLEGESAWVTGGVRGFQGLPGHSRTATGELFVCSVCGSPWHRPAVGDTVPPCPIHLVPRVRAQA